MSCCGEQWACLCRTERATQFWGKVGTRGAYISGCAALWMMVGGCFLLSPAYIASTEYSVLLDASVKCFATSDMDLAMECVSQDAGDGLKLRNALIDAGAALTIVGATIMYTGFMCFVAGARQRYATIPEGFMSVVMLTVAWACQLAAAALAIPGGTLQDLGLKAAADPDAEPTPVGEGQLAQATAMAIALLKDENARMCLKGAAWTLIALFYIRNAFMIMFKHSPAQSTWQVKDAWALAIFACIAASYPVTAALCGEEMCPVEPTEVIMLAPVHLFGLLGFSIASFLTINELWSDYREDPETKRLRDNAI